MSKYCIDCKWCVPLFDLEHRCEHPLTVSHDVVDGTAQFSSCRMNRKLDKCCSVDGKLWEEREPLAISIYNRFVRFFGIK